MPAIARLNCRDPIAAYKPRSVGHTQRTHVHVHTRNRKVAQQRITS